MEGKDFKMPESALLDENAPLEEKLRRIDESIEKQQKAVDELQASILALKSQRNSLVPISCIPSEILGHIFTCVQAPELSKDPVLRGKREFLDRVALSHVCYHWRNIAVHSPNLWGALPIGKGKWVEEILKRSKGSCLDVNVAGILNIAAEIIEPGLSLALMHGHRLRELCLRRVHWSTSSFLTVYLPKSAPQLERFHLIGDPEEDIALVLGPQLYIPDCALNETPRLRELELANCSINWNSHHLLQCPLTHLKLTNISSNFALSGKRFMVILKSMPELQDLELNNCLPPRSQQGASSWGPEKIHLLHLQTLRIESSQDKVEDFFHCVTFPPTAIVNIVLHHEQSYPDFSAVISEIALSYHYADLDTVFQSLIFEHGRPGRLQLKLFTEVLSNFDTIRRADIAIAHLDMLFYYPDSDHISLPKLMRDIFNGALRLDCIRHAWLTEMAHAIIPDLLANTLGRLPLLNSVIVSPSATKTFLAALVHIELRRDITGAQAYFPAVSSICLYDATFVKTLSPQVATFEISAEMIQSFLIQRHEIALPIETLVLLGCRVLAKEDIILLKKNVANVHRIK